MRTIAGTWSLVALCVLGTSSNAQTQQPTTGKTWEPQRFEVPNQDTGKNGSTWLSDFVESPPPPPSPNQMGHGAPLVNELDAAGDGSCCDGGCDTCCFGYCGRGCCGHWFGSAGALLMNRDRANDVWLSFDSADPTARLLTAHSASMDWAGGVDVSLGRYFCGGRCGFEAVYWGVGDTSSEANAYGAAVGGILDTVVDFTPVVWDNGGGEQPVAAYYNFAERHRVRRGYEYNNVELNLFCIPCCCRTCCGSGYSFQWGGGLRYFRLAEDMQYATDLADVTFGNDAANELFYDIDAENHLLGFQMTGRGDWYMNRCFSLYAGVKAGIFGNHITHSQFIGNGTNVATIDDPGGPYDDAELDVRSYKNEVSFLGEIDLGMRYKFLRCWSASVGYRAVGITGVALATQQIPDYFEDLNDIRSIDSSGSLLLHGGYARVEYNF